MEENINNTNSVNVQKDGVNNMKLIAGAILIAGIIIAGAILLKGKSAPTPTTDNNQPALAQVDPVTATDHVLGDPNAKVTMIEYADFQCPFCGKFFTETAQPVIEKYVKTGKVQFVFRDFAFLGPESIKSAEASWCAGDQNKYWEFHDYLFTHQNGENKGAFADANLKTFAVTLGLDATTFNQCLDSGKYTKTVTDMTAAAGKAGVQGTPKSFILKKGKVVSTVDGAYPLADVSAKLDAALK
jgi:protein-disulfide isomerase